MPVDVDEISGETGENERFVVGALEDRIEGGRLALEASPERLSARSRPPRTTGASEEE